MSTKIYEAYKTDSMDNFDKFLKSYRKYLFKSVGEHLFKIKDCISNTEGLKKLIQDKEIIKQEHIEKYSIEFLQYAYLFWNMIDQSSKQRKELCNMDCSFNFWLDKGIVYFIPYLPCWQVAKIPNVMKKRYNLQDYSYWNNSDPPEEIPDKEWGKRGKTWDRLALDPFDKWNENRYERVMIDASRFPYIGLSEIENTLYENKENTFVTPSYIAIFAHTRIK